MEKQLILGPYSGATTEHVKIAFGTGICGQAADSGEIFLVQDVSKEWNYLACSPHVKAEIVVPVFHEGTFVGEIDIDSHTQSPFTAQDTAFLEDLADWVAHLLVG
jgi:GAF domain-containing protein